MKSVYSAVRTWSLNKAVYASSLKGYFDYSEITFLYTFHPLHTHPLLVHLDMIVFILFGYGRNHKAPQHVIFPTRMSLTVSPVPFSIT